MHCLGIDLGSSTVKVVLMKDQKIEAVCGQRHYGMVLNTLIDILKTIDLPDEVSVSVTGVNSGILTSVLPTVHHLGDIPAIVGGVRYLYPDAGSVIEIGSQSARFITDLQDAVPKFSVNEHCAGGTGSFFEDQMSRLGLKIEDYSSIVEKAVTIPRLSGRCAVFAKTDIIHRQQEGVPTPDILLGLCYAMIRNYKATIVRNLPVRRPIAFCGGVTKNSGVYRAIREVFGLSDGELISDEYAVFAAAVGSATVSKGSISKSEILTALQAEQSKKKRAYTLPPLKLKENTPLSDPKGTQKIPTEGCALGIDIGSTSTDLVLTAKDGTIIDFWYLRTLGDPESAVRKGLKEIHAKYGDIRFTAVGVTGSGRERLGRMMGADAVRDEITSQAKAACRFSPEADTVFEIGGQDSKYISLKDGEVASFQMNKICAAGTGSFIEEQAVRMGIPLNDFGALALTSDSPVELGDRCTVFIETTITSAAAEGASSADIAAGLCHSVVRNYLHKVVGSNPVGKNIVLQGGVAYNPGIVAAYQSAYPDITVSPVFSVSGAYGVSLLALEAIGDKESTFLGFDFPHEDINRAVNTKQIQENRAFYKKPGQLLMEGYDGKLDPKKKTVGIPLVLIMHKFFPMANAYFKSLGFNVLLSEPTNEDTIKLAQMYAQSETCYPVKLIYGHMVQLMEKGVDYIFLPAIHTIKHPHSHVKHNYACVYMQTAARSIADVLKLEEKGIQLLNPLFDLDLGQKAMAMAMVGLGQSLGFSKPRCMKALLSGAMAVRKFSAAVEEQGQAMLASLKPEDKVLVLITRNYGVLDPVLNMGIPEILLQRGYKVITLAHLPGHGLDISKDYPNMYWPFGEHILSGAKIISHHPNLYAVYLTNHGCGPDSLVSHMFREEMGDKPYLQIEVDEHYSKVGVITRIEAFLNSLSRRPASPLPENFDLKAVAFHPANITGKPQSKKTLYIPNMGLYTDYIADYFSQSGINAVPMRSINREQLLLGRSEMNSKEYLPFAALLGAVFSALNEASETPQFLIPFDEGADADGQYARAIRTVLDRKGYRSVDIISPVLETLPETAENCELLFRALLTGDILYAAPADKRAALAPDKIPDKQELLALAKQVSAYPVAERRLAAVGTPLCLTSLDEGILDTLEKEENTILRMPLSEYMWFMWKDAGATDAALKDFLAFLKKVSKNLGVRSSFSQAPESLISKADGVLKNFSGGNGRYRYVKTVELGKTANGVLEMVPRYENTSMILDMRGLQTTCSAPMFQVYLDGDWDEMAWSRLRSFLYYC